MTSPTVAFSRTASNNAAEAADQSNHPTEADGTTKPGKSKTQPRLPPPANPVQTHHKYLTSLVDAWSKVPQDPQNPGVGLAEMLEQHFNTLTQAGPDGASKKADMRLLNDTEKAALRDLLLTARDDDAARSASLRRFMKDHHLNSLSIIEGNKVTTIYRTNDRKHRLACTLDGTTPLTIDNDVFNALTNAWFAESRIVGANNQTAQTAQTAHVAEAE